MAKVRNSRLKTLFSSKIQKVRSELGMTQLELSELLQIDASYLSLMERCKKPIPISDFFLACSLLPRERALQVMSEILEEVSNSEKSVS